MKRIIATFIIGVAAVMVVAATIPGGYHMPEEDIFYWHRGDTALGSMTIDSCVSTYACTSKVTANQFGADSVLFHIYSNGGDTTGTPDTVWLIAEGLDRWTHAVIDSSLLLVDTLNDSIGDNLFKIWNTKCTYWPYMRLIRKVVEDTTGTGYSVDSTYGVMYPLEAR